MLPMAVFLLERPNVSFLHDGLHRRLSIFLFRQVCASVSTVACLIPVHRHHSWSPCLCAIQSEGRFRRRATAASKGQNPRDR